jgi:hypothetical protein
LFKNNLLVNKYLPLSLDGKRKQKIPKQNQPVLFDFLIIGRPKVWVDLDSEVVVWHYKT